MAGCGGTGHEGDCLCDVVIGTPVPINYSFTDVRHGDIVARATGYQGGAGANLADYLEALASAVDATAHLRDFEPNWLDGVKDMLPQIKEHLGCGESIIDLPDILGVSFAQIVGALGGGQATMIWTWDELTWIEFEIHLQGDSISYQETADRFGINHEQVARLAKLYGRKPPLEGARERNARLRSLVDEHPDWKASQIHQQLLDEGHNPTTLVNTRKRMYDYKSSLAAA